MKCGPDFNAKFSTCIQSTARGFSHFLFFSDSIQLFIPLCTVTRNFVSFFSLLWIKTWSSLRHMRGEDFQSLLIPQEYSYSSEKSDNDMYWIWKPLQAMCFWNIGCSWLMKATFSLRKSVSLRKSKELFIRNKT